MAAALFHYETPRPDGDWIGWRTHIELAGSQHNSSEINDFIKSTRHLKAGVEDPIVELVREPTNQFDRNAVRLFAEWKGQKWMLGYVSREVAHDLAEDFPSVMPLSARLIRIVYSGDMVFVRIHVLTPSKKWRTAAGWLK